MGVQRVSGTWAARARATTSTVLRIVLVVALAGTLATCSDGDGDEGASVATTHAADLPQLTALLPEDARGVFAADLTALRAGDSADEVEALLAGEGGDPVLVDEPLGEIGALTDAFDVTDDVTSALLAQTTDNAEGSLLVAKLDEAALDDAVADWSEPASTHGPESRPLHSDGDGHRAAVLPDGVLVVGARTAVESVVDVADGTTPAGASPIAPFLPALDADADLSLAYGLPALVEDVAPAGSLRSADVMSGTLDVVDGDLDGTLAFHTVDADAFVDRYNTLNRYALQGDDPAEEPLSVAAPVAAGLDRVVVPLPASPLDGSPDETLAVRNVAKKLFVGMEADDYAGGVSSTGNAPWIDLIIKSEADGDTPPSPGAVFFRWRFRDRAAREAFARDVLPPGFTLAPTQFLESDDPEGEYFVALMLYDAGGGSIVDGARAEWDVFVSPPAGADPDAPARPRYMIIQALSANVSFDPTTLLSEANPVSYEIEGDEVVASVSERDGDEDVPVFTASFPLPDPETADPVRWTAEMAIANDYMHWPNGVYDHIVYNATTYNWEGRYVDTERTTIDDRSRWARYIEPELLDATYYLNTLEYVASPLANLDSPYLDVTPDERADLLAFKDNGHQRGVMRGRVEQLFQGTGDAYVGFEVPNQVPTTYYDFEVTDPEGLEEALDLPDGVSLMPTTRFEGEPEGYRLTLAVRQVAGAPEGTTAQWSVVVDDGRGRPRQQVLDLMTEDVAADPVGFVALPSDVRHRVSDGAIRTRLSSPTISFDATVPTRGSTEEAVTMDWVESGDEVCVAGGACDRYYYDAETLDVPVHRAADVTVDEVSTPWDEFVDATPTVFHRDNAQGYAVKRWHDLEVAVEVPEPGGLEGATHRIEGEGTLVGRTSPVADSDYTYTGDAVVEDDELTFSIDQRVDNALGVTHIYTEGSFDLTTGQGTQTVVDCRGAALMCSDIRPGSEAPYTAQGLDASDPDAITWRVDLAVDLENFGRADSASAFRAVRAE